MTTGDRCVVWFRRDLRLDDNPAWAAGIDYAAVTALYVLDPRLFTADAEFRRDQLLAHLRSLDADLAERGGRLRVVSATLHRSSPRSHLMSERALFWQTPMRRPTRVVGIPPCTEPSVRHHFEHGGGQWSIIRAQS